MPNAILVAYLAAGGQDPMFLIGYSIGCVIALGILLLLVALA